MGKKFDAIYEAVISRYNVGGYLPGDIIKFRPDYKSSETYKAMPSLMKQELDELANSGLNIKVVQIGTRVDNHSISVNPKLANDVVITIAGDHGGRHFGTIAVAPDMIDLEDPNNPTPKVPDQFKWDDSKYTKFEAEEYKPDEKNITRVTDKGNGKNTPTQLKLAGESVRITRDNEKMAELYEKTLNQA
jgi:hypothetical protein